MTGVRVDAEDFVLDRLGLADEELLQLRVAHHLRVILEHLCEAPRPGPSSSNTARGEGTSSRVGPSRARACARWREVGVRDRESSPSDAVACTGPASGVGRRSRTLVTGAATRNSNRCGGRRNAPGRPDPQRSAAGRQAGLFTTETHNSMPELLLCTVRAERLAERRHVGNR